MDPLKNTRRVFLQSAAATGAGMLVASDAMALPEKPQSDPNAAMMQEHGILRRALLVYRHCLDRLRTGQTKGLAQPLNDTAQLFRRIGEEFHERAIEEKFVLPVLQQLDAPLSRYPAILMAQHAQGRDITSFIIDATRSGSIASGDASHLIRALDGFILMYQEHAAREDTEVYIAWRKALAPARYQEMGHLFREISDRMIGMDGFEAGVKQISNIESGLGIADLQQFTVRG